MLLQELPHQRGLVSREIVEDDVDLLMGDLTPPIRPCGNTIWMKAGQANPTVISEPCGTMGEGCKGGLRLKITLTHYRLIFLQARAP
jgi:hypothetical protein